MVRKLAARIREVHPYELPEIIVLPIIGGDEGYLDWISESVKKSSGSGDSNAEDV
jgi:periplasmic divalent cation tolerance protein